MEQHFTQNNYYQRHFDLGELFKPVPPQKVSLPAWLYVACILSVVAVPFVQSWIAMGVELQVFLYGAYRCSTDKAKIVGLVAVTLLWGALLFAFPPRL